VFFDKQRCDIFSDDALRRDVQAACLEVVKIESFDVSAAVINAWRSRAGDLCDRLGDEKVHVVRRYHGTRTSNHSSIKKLGLVVPGTHGVAVANGSALGNGIYLAQSASTSTSYSADGAILLVCAVLCANEICADRCILHNGGVSVSFRGDLVLPIKAVHYRMPGSAHHYVTQPLPPARPVQRARTCAARFFVAAAAVASMAYFASWLVSDEGGDTCPNEHFNMTLFESPALFP
jgi:hypothetical protein